MFWDEQFQVLVSLVGVVIMKPILTLSTPIPTNSIKNQAYSAIHFKKNRVLVSFQCF